jgi:hypothetical protein
VPGNPSQPATSGSGPSAVAGEEEPWTNPPAVVAGEEPRTNSPAVVAQSIGGPVPEPSTGYGLLSVSSTPWGRVSVDGRDVCDSPCTVRLRAGRHRVVVTNPKLGLSARHDVSVRAGRRSSLLPTLLKR